MLILANVKVPVQFCCVICFQSCRHVASKRCQLIKTVCVSAIYPSTSTVYLCLSIYIYISSTVCFPTTSIKKNTKTKKFVQRYSDVQFLNIVHQTVHAKRNLPHLLCSAAQHLFDALMEGKKNKNRKSVNLQCVSADSTTACEKKKSCFTQKVQIKLL